MKTATALVESPLRDEEPRELYSVKSPSAHLTENDSNRPSNEVLYCAACKKEYLRSECVVDRSHLSLNCPRCTSALDLLDADDMKGMHKEIKPRSISEGLKKGNSEVTMSDIMKTKEQKKDEDN